MEEAKPTAHAGALICPACGVDNQNDSDFCRGCALYLQLVGRYRLCYQLVSGGFGTIYKALNPQTYYPVALKVLQPHLSQNPQMQERFVREVQVLEQLHHPHVVHIFEHGQLDKIGHYYVMEWLEGETLRTLCADQEPQIARVLRWFTQILDGLQAIHEQGIVHRDLKPDNIMLLTQGSIETVKIIDFGIAKTETWKNTTQTGVLLGSPRFMAPEQIDRSIGSIDPRTDVYAAGILLAWLLTGRHVFSSDDERTLCHNHCYTPAPTLSMLAPEHLWSAPLEALVARALAKEPAHRYASIEAFQKALAAISPHHSASSSTDELVRLHWQEHLQQANKSTPLPQLYRTPIQVNARSISLKPALSHTPLPPPPSHMWESPTPFHVRAKCLYKNWKGVVYQAKHSISQQRELLLLCPLTQAVPSDNALAHFFKRAELLQALKHPHIIPLKDYGITREHIYMSSPYVYGETLYQLLEEASLWQRSWSLATCLERAKELALALEASHQQGCFHLDLSPHTIIQLPTEKFQLRDIGINAPLIRLQAEGLLDISPPPQLQALVHTARDERELLRYDLQQLGWLLVAMLLGTNITTPHSHTIPDVLWQQLSMKVSHNIGLLELVEGLVGSPKTAMIASVKDAHLQIKALQEQSETQAKTC